MSPLNLIQICGYIVTLSPFVLLAIITLRSLPDRQPSERRITRLNQLAIAAGLLPALLILVLMLVNGIHHVSLDLGNWFEIPQQHFHFHLKFVFDRLSVPFVILALVLCGTIGAFASRYLHREPGFLRFFVCYSLFLAGIVTSALAGTIETLFLGWELVGLSSALLVAYFHERQNPVRNGLRVWSVYRVADAAFLLAALLLHHLTGAGDFEELMGQGPWPEGAAAVSESSALLVGLLLLTAAAGKSALIPFSGWLPRAMEGPTPSSAIFYGSLSVHLGAFLLLRVSPLLEVSSTLSLIVVAVGLGSAALGAIAARVQSDIKTALAFASLTQVGIIVAEIGLGFRYLALVHMIGHACLRTLQLLRAPSALRDHNSLRNAIGRSSERAASASNEQSWLRWSLYQFAFERGYLDQILDEWIVRPLLRGFCWCDLMERRWLLFLSGDAPAASEHDPPVSPSAEAPSFSAADATAAIISQSRESQS